MSSANSSNKSCSPSSDEDDEGEGRLGGNHVGFGGGFSLRSCHRLISQESWRRQKECTGPAVDPDR